jgi:hypothetical protein
MKCGETPEHAEFTEFTSAKKSTLVSQFKTMLMSFFDHEGIVHYEVIAQAQTVTYSE